MAGLHLALEWKMVSHLANGFMQNHGWIPNGYMKNYGWIVENVVETLQLSMDHSMKMSHKDWIGRARCQWRRCHKLRLH
ncbi:hypothetical protein TSUD_30410 [Trifolium subterraneum]|uniref:Uncharacterized protein n=1 Tax=Trifolium subterraneum TaxID=3900 RepID=A0A2Z6MSJ4_TRISU|nr:hypothetical protein TSUD_30410 [Trifolium subterraneum]